MSILAHHGYKNDHRNSFFKPFFYEWLNLSMNGRKVGVSGGTTSGKKLLKEGGFTREKSL